MEEIGIEKFLSTSKNGTQHKMDCDFWDFASTVYLSFFWGGFSISTCDAPDKDKLTKEETHSRLCQK